MTATAIVRDIGNTFKHPIKTVKTHPVRFLVVAGTVYLLADYIVSAKGKSTVAKVTGKVTTTAHRLAGGKPKALPGAAAAAQRAAAAGYFAGAPFGPGWGRGNMPYMYGGGYPETPAQIASAHRAFAAASGAYPEMWTQSSYPWS